MTLESATLKKTIKVVAAVMTKDENVFCAERAYGFLKGKWEFPGGKVEKGESSEQALIREIQEELNTLISVDSFLMNVHYEYDTFVLDMDVFNCHIAEGRLAINEDIHLAEAWLPIGSINQEDWCPADQSVVAKLQQNFLDKMSK